VYICPLFPISQFSCFSVNWGGKVEKWESLDVTLTVHCILDDTGEREKDLKYINTFLHEPGTLSQDHWMYSLHLPVMYCIVVRFEVGVEEEESKVHL